MFDSGKTAKTLIDELKSEADIAVEIPDIYYIDWLNALEQMLYDNVIREEEHDNSDISAPGTAFTQIVAVLPTSGSTGERIRFEDVVSIRIDGRELTRVSTNVGGRCLFPYTYWKGHKIVNGVSVPAAICYVKGTNNEDVDFDVVYTVRPKLKTANNIDDADEGVVCVPPEYIDMVKAKLRGEAYKLANDDVLAAKWLNDYNTQIEYFRAWIASKRGILGV